MALNWGTERSGVWGSAFSRVGRWCLDQSIGDQSMRTILSAVACFAVLTSNIEKMEAGLILSDDFNSGVGVGTFQSIQNAAAIGDGVPGFLSGNALHFGRQNSLTPFAITNALDVSSGGTISFDFRGGNENVDGSSYWENSEGSGEWVDLAYSTDGGLNFVNLFVLDTEADQGENPTVWNSANIAIPFAAQTAATQFRFQQRFNDGPSFDHWAIDNLAVETPDISAVPEPTSIALFGVSACFAGVGAVRRRRRGDNSQNEVGA